MKYLFLVLFLIFSASSYANMTEARIKSKFTDADVNADGKLTLEEAKSGMPKVADNFTKIDADDSGYVTVEEIITSYEKE